MRFLTLSLAAALLAPVIPGESGIVWTTGFGRSAIWNDGNAEVSVYQARDVKYGIPRNSRATLIVVAEDLSAEKMVKADHPEAGRTRRVLKLNHVRSIPTGVYIYEQMLSVFLGAERMEPVKLTVSSHEWCGNSFVEWRSDQNRLSIRSYFESVADRELSLDPGTAVFYDSLPLKLRSLDFPRTREGQLALLDTLFSASPSAPGVRQAELRVRAISSSAYRVEMTSGERRDKLDVFDFEAAPPHRLVRWERSDGGVLTLIDSRRFRYWEKNRPGEESLLPAALRDH